MSSIQDIAKMAGVSLSTVSRVFNNSGYVSDEKRELVLAAARSIGYKPPKKVNRTYEKMSTDIIGVVVTDINNPFFSEAIKGMMNVLNGHGINILICDTDERPEQEIQILQTLRRKKVGGIIITPTSEAVQYNADYLKEVNDCGIPIVLMDREIKHVGFDGVYLDSFNGALKAVDALARNGHSNIAIITGPISSKPGIDRFNGYLEALRINNLPIKEEHIFYGNFKEETAYELTKELLDTRPEVTAIFSSNNLMSAGSFEAIKERGLNIPDDIALISFDDFYFFGTNSIRISAVSRPTRQMGIEAANLLIERMKVQKHKSTVSKQIVLTPRLVLRGSEVYPKNRR
jgi:LacI family transcriptional regulator